MNLEAVQRSQAAVVLQRRRKKASVRSTASPRPPRRYHGDLGWLTLVTKGPLRAAAAQAPTQDRAEREAEESHSLRVSGTGTQKRAL